MGRWLSPDWSAKVEPVPYSKLDDPQSLNLYAYVGNNPTMRVDPDGHDGVDNWMQMVAGAIPSGPCVGSIGDCSGNLRRNTPEENNAPHSTFSNRPFSTTDGAVSTAEGKADYGQAVDYLRTSKTMRGVVNKFENGHNPIVFIKDAKGDRFQGGAIYWDPHGAINTTSGGTISPALALGHEMTQATGNWLGTLIRSMIPDDRFDNLEERRVILRFENPAARELHEGVRTDHSCGDPCTFYVPSPIQN